MDDNTVRSGFRSQGVPPGMYLNLQRLKLHLKSVSELARRYAHRGDTQGVEDFVLHVGHVVAGPSSDGYDHAFYD